ncbi:hypothetical protein [Pseudomonas fluorescens]|uniref:hypothetical protein n=1 Tax=Pseudomonas fluorescens TaxID=294 RepID=UPI001249B9A1|nr:hypothetical protein [Pseudomonas fluorescens]CAG8870118.1 hypothetical protein PS861_03309 [Pseudomonas fluorescens]
MTCILVAHLGSEVVVAADKRVVRYEADGTRTVIGDNEEKIVRTAAGVVTGCGALPMLEPVKNVLSTEGFSTTDEVLELIQQTRNAYAKANVANPRLAADLAETSWLFTYPAMANEQAVTRAVFFHQSISTENFAVVGEGRVMCFPGGFSREQAQEVQAQLQGVVTSSLSSYPYEQAKQAVIGFMLRLMSEVAETSISVSSACDVAVINGTNADIWLDVPSGDAV